MKTLAVDIETYSSVDITKAGAYRYAEAPDFTILLIAYAWDDEPVQLIDLAQGARIPAELRDALLGPTPKTAYNANFERLCFNKYFGVHLSAENWYCTMVHAATLGLPGGLGAVAKALNLPEDQQKLAEGKALIRYFCRPCAPTKANGGRTRNLPQHAPDKWERFCAYCKQDVVTECAIRNKLAVHPVPESEHALYVIDQAINDRGVAIDPILVSAAIQGDEHHRATLLARARALTGLENPKSVTQLKGWLKQRLGTEIPSLAKTETAGLLETIKDPVVREVLEARQQFSKTSTAKYLAMQTAVCADGRVHGTLQFYGASRTGRWAGRLVQVQNLAKNHLPDRDLDLARQFARIGEMDALALLFGNVADTLSQLIRTALVPSPGCRFIVSDFSAIEARVVAWLAGEDWVLEVFRGHGKIYEATASQMFGVPIETIKKGSALRQQGKVAQLACGYGGGAAAMARMDYGHAIDPELYGELVQRWRQANPHITKYWRIVEKAALTAVRGHTRVDLPHGVYFRCGGGVLYAGLPSGRELAYLRPRIEPDPANLDRMGLTYEGKEQNSLAWGRLRTWGGKLTENITQAVARDCLAVSMARLCEAGHRIVFHVHDEVILDTPAGHSSAEEVAALMGQSIPWAPGLPLAADAYECEYYRKD